jgi:hypothetical protein
MVLGWVRMKCKRRFAVRAGRARESPDRSADGGEGGGGVGRRLAGTGDGDRRNTLRENQVEARDHVEERHVHLRAVGRGHVSRLTDSEKIRGSRASAVFCAYR